MKVKSESEVTQSCLSHQAPPPMGFSRQEYWSGVPLPSPSFKSINIQMGPPLALHVCHLEFISLDLCPGHACAYALTFFSRQ